MFTEAKITEIFCLADDFCKVFNKELRTRQLKDGRPHRNKPGRLSDSEVMTILIIFSHFPGNHCGELDNSLLETRCMENDTR